MQTGDHGSFNDNKDVDLINKGFIEYNLDYKHDNDDLRDKYFYSKLPILSGEIIKTSIEGYYYNVIVVYHDDDGANLLLSKSAQTITEAIYRPYDYEDTPLAKKIDEALLSIKRVAVSVDPI